MSTLGEPGEIIWTLMDLLHERRFCIHESARA